MQDRLLESRELRDLRVGVQWVAVAIEPVQQRLVGARRIGDLVIGIAVRHLRRVGDLRPTVLTEAALAADERGEARRERRFAGSGVGRLRLEPHHGCLALVVDPDDLGHGVDLAVGRDRAVHGHPLLTVQQHPEVELAPTRQARTAAHTEDDRHRRQHALLDVLRVLGGELQLEPGRIHLTRADSERVEQCVLRRPRVAAGLRDGTNGFQVHRHGVAP